MASIAMLVVGSFIPDKGGVTSLKVAASYRTLLAIVFLVTAALFMRADWNTADTIKGEIEGRGAFLIAVINFFVSVGPIPAGLIWGAFGLFNARQAWRGFQLLKSGVTEWTSE